jgi:hypothetical protein
MKPAAELYIFYGNFVYDSRMVRSRTAFAAEFAICGHFSVSNHRCYNSSEIKPAFHALLAQTVYPEKRITIWEKINGSRQWLSYTLLTVVHANADACDLWKD